MRLHSILATLLIPIAGFLSAQTPELTRLPLSELQSLVEQGDAAAMVQLGLRYNYGPGLPFDLEKTRHWFEQAASKGHPTALGLCLLNGFGREQDRDLGFQTLEKAAAAGDSIATRLLGRCHQYGWGCEADAAKAFEFYQRADAMSRDNATVGTLASCHLDGIGCEPDAAKAVALFEEAAALGSSPSCLSLGHYYNEKDPAKANDCYRKAGELGSGLGYRYLGINYQNGVGTEKDPAKANEHYLKAGELGDGGGYRYLGNNHANGAGTEKDLAKANDYYQLGADLGDSTAMNNLGNNLLKGEGIGRNPAKGVEWLQKSADLGNSFGQWNLGKLHASGRAGVERDFSKAFELFTKASEQNHSAATYDLAACYEYGLGTEKDLAKARELYQKALDLGDTSAAAKVQKLSNP